MIFITLQPGLVSYSLKSLTCKEVGHKSFTLISSHFECSDGFYISVIKPLNSVVLSILIFILPLIIFIHGFYLVKAYKSQRKTGIVE